MSTLFPPAPMAYYTANHASIDDHFHRVHGVSSEDLPGYENEEAPPSYLSPPSPGQEVRYKLKQFDRASQKLIPLSVTSKHPSLTITTKTRSKLFSSPPDIQFALEKPNGAVVAPTEAAIVTVRFDDGAKSLPYCPKAILKVMGGNGIMIHEQSLHSDDFVNWKMQLGGVEHYWGVRLNPNALVLKSKATEQEVARLTYSEVGTDASHGDYVGELVVREWGVEGELKGLLVTVSAFLVVVYWRKLGRNYKNRGQMMGGREVILTSPH